MRVQIAGAKVPKGEVERTPVLGVRQSSGAFLLRALTAHGTYLVTRAIRKFKIERVKVLDDFDVMPEW
jgi:hypothetical protein